MIQTIEHTTSAHVMSRYSDLIATKAAKELAKSI